MGVAPTYCRLLAPLLWRAYATWNQPIWGLLPTGHGTCHHPDTAADHCCPCHRVAEAFVSTFDIWGTFGPTEHGAANDLFCGSPNPRDVTERVPRGYRLMVNSTFFSVARSAFCTIDLQLPPLPIEETLPRQGVCVTHLYTCKTSVSCHYIYMQGAWQLFP